MNEQNEVARMNGTCPSACCELTSVELVDAAYELVFAYKPESPAQEAWKRKWLSNAKRYGAGFDCCANTGRRNDDGSV